MKANKKLLLAIIITTMFMNTAVGLQVKDTIDVLFNKVDVTLNGEKVDADNFLYEGTTYVSIRVISEILGKESKI